MSIRRSAVKYVLLLVFGALYAVPAVAQSVPFTWDNATVYFAMTDRFANGSEDNDRSYNRGLDGELSPYPKEGNGFFWGGDFAGLTSKLNEGYFNRLGIDAIWISPPFEQVHGWIAAKDGLEQSYAYHGYWLLDPTEFDANFGTDREFRELVDSAHSNGIRIIVDVVMNHPGYATLSDMDSYSFGEVDSLWRSWRPSAGESWSSFHDLFVDYDVGRDSTGWKNWWGPEWTRAGLAGYEPCGSNDVTMCLSSLPDFRTDSNSEVSLPQFLLTKWGPDKIEQETSSLDAFFRRTGYPRTPANHLIKWLTDIVREYGVDGYRIDTAKHVEPENWERLLEEASVALQDHWDANQVPTGFQPMPFWSVGEIYGLSPEMVTAGQDIVFDGYINFEIPYRDLLDIQELDSLYLAYSNHVGTLDSKSFMSYISSHDEGIASREKAFELATSFVMLPGTIQLLFGDEVSRTATGMNSVDAARTPMDWNNIDREILAHWEKLLQFRHRHPSIGAGSHEMIESSPYMFRRSLNYGTYQDNTMIVVGAAGRTRVNVSKSFADDSIVRDAYSGKTSIVTFGFVTLTADPSGIMLLEEID